MKAVYGALLKAQKDFDPVLKDATNPAFRSKYATLSSVLSAVEPGLQKHGLVLVGSLRSEVLASGSLMVYVGLDVAHAESEETIHSELGLIPAKQDPQGVGSAITYGRRYLLMTMLGLAAEDDDGNGASKPPQQASRPLPPPQPPHAPDAEELRQAAAEIIGPAFDEATMALWASDKATASFDKLDAAAAQRLVTELARRRDAKKAKA